MDKGGVGQVVECELSAGDGCVLGYHGVGGDSRRVRLDPSHLKPVLGELEGDMDGYADIR